MCPHLEREEREMMPVVSQSITNGEWRAWEDGFTKVKSMKQLADEGHWLLDNLDAGRRDFVVRLVPAVPRFILVNFLGGPYRKKSALLWGGTPAAECRRCPSTTTPSTPPEDPVGIPAQPGIASLVTRADPLAPPSSGPCASQVPGVASVAA